MSFSMHKKSFRSLLAFIPAAVVLCIGTSFAQKVFNEAGGIIIGEAESTESPLGSWVKVTTPAGFTGTCGFEFTGNSPSGGSANSPLKYQFKITTAGIYKMSIRAHKRLAGAAGDLCNDCYWRVDGDYTAGGTAPLTFLKSDGKLYCYGLTPTTWDWSNSFDHAGGTVAYNFKAGQTYTLTISGRSQRYNFDRWTFFLDANSAKALNPATPESSTGPVAAPTCTDGIKNGDETGIDCGGSCPNTCAVVTPTCTDGIQNGDETGVDCGGSCPNTCSVTPACTQSYSYKAATDFTIIPATATTATYYVEAAAGRLAIGATTVAYRNKWAAAELTFKGVDCTYDFKVTGHQETDGETSYKVFVNGTQLGTTVKNSRITDKKLDYTPQIHVMGSKLLKNGDKIRVESDCNSNGLIPEGSAFAWARGRWSLLQLTPGTVAVMPATAQKTVVSSALSYANGNLTFAAPASGKYTVSLFSLSGKIVNVRTISMSGTECATVSLAGLKTKGTFIVDVKGTGYSANMLIIR